MLISASILLWVICFIKLPVFLDSNSSTSSTLSIIKFQISVPSTLHMPRWSPLTSSWLVFRECKITNQTWKCKSTSKIKKHTVQLKMKDNLFLTIQHHLSWLCYHSEDNWKLITQTQGEKKKQRHTYTIPLFMYI